MLTKSYIAGMDDAPEETYRYEIHPSILGFVIPMLAPFFVMTIIAGFFMFGPLKIGEINGINGHAVIMTLVRWGFVFSFLNAGLLEIRRRCTVLKLGAKTLVYKTGIFFTSTDRIRYGDIRNMKVEATLVEKLFGIGSIAVATAGTAGYEAVMRSFVEPEKIMRFIAEAGNR